MKRLEWIATPVGLAVVVAAAAVKPWLALVGGLSVAAVALLLWAPPVLALALPFVVVQVLGEGLRLPGMPLGAAQLCYVLVVGVVVLRRSACLPRLTGPLDRGVAALALVTLVATIAGVVGGAEAALIKEDVVPIIFLVATYIATRVLVRTKTEFDIVLAAVLAGSFLAAIKVAYLLVTPVTVGWEGPWQAIRLLAYGSPRVVLRGADLFFVVSTLIVVARLMSPDRATVGAVVAGVLSLGGVVLAGTRSNWIGLAAGIVALVVAGAARSHLRPRRIATGLAACALIVLVILASSASARQFGEKLIDASGARQWTVTYRVLETRGVLTAIGSVYGLGNGMGSTYTYWHLERRAVERTTWTHNAYLQWLMKAGVVGLLVFLGVMFRAGRTAAGLVRARHPWAAGLLGLVGALVAVLVLSLAANKVFEFSGAMFLGLALGAIQGAEESERDR